MKTYLLFFLIITSTIGVNAQILNAESLRKVTDTSGFSGNANVSFALKRNVNDIIKLSSNVHVQYKMKKHLVLFKNDIAFQKLETEDFENSAIQHVRYNYKISERITWEVFGQSQYNKVSKINFRGLLGTGPRFKLTKNENYKAYIGTLAMYEYEEIDDGFTPIQRDLRGSTYFSCSLYPSSTVSFISTTYYQPKLNTFSDYRISSQSSLAVSLFKNFAIELMYTFTYDAFPAIGIPNSQYDFSTGLTYAFD